MIVMANLYVLKEKIKFTLQITFARPTQVDICHNHALTSFLGFKVYSKLFGLTSTSMDRDSIDWIVHFQSVEANVILRIDFSCAKITHMYMCSGLG